MKLRNKIILIIVFLFLGIISFYKFFSISKEQGNLLNFNIFDDGKFEYKISRLNNSVEEVIDKFYRVYYVLNKFGKKVADERLVKEDFTIELIGDDSVYHLLGEPYDEAGYLVYDKQGNEVDLEVKVSSNIDVNKKGVYGVIYHIPDGTIVTRTVYVVSEIPKCEGYVNRYGTTLIYRNPILTNDEEYIDGIFYGERDYVWEIDGEIVTNRSNKLNVAYKKIDSATVNVIIDGIKTSCEIKNNLMYDFKYDSKNEKPYIGCRTYDENDKTRLDSILKNVVNEGGYGTRAGVVEAARFLVGGLDYKIKYVGPKQGSWQIGRYPYEGLNINAYSGWGCGIRVDVQGTQKSYTQGMDCTNFVSWAFAQAGLKTNNVYGTQNVYPIVDVIDRLQVGDLLLTPNDTTFSHVGIVIGIDDSSIYVAEATTGSINAIVTTKMDKSNLPIKGKFSKARLYEYEEEGNVTNMWVS